jgi:phosphonate utilization transcriptional regulator
MASMKTNPTHGGTIALLQSHSLTSLVQQEVERMVLAGEIAPGERLGEAELAERLGVSRGPVREAFRALEEAGLLRLEKNRGVFVREIAVQEADECYAVRAVLEELVGRILATRIAEAELEELRALLDRMDKAAARGQVDIYAKLNLEFHDRLVALTGNAKLAGIYRRLVKELILFRRQALAQGETLAASAAEHRAIIDTIAARDPRAAGRALFDHVTASRERMHKLHGPRAVATPTTRASHPHAKAQTQRGATNQPITTRGRS